MVLEFAVQVFYITLNSCCFPSTKSPSLPSLSLSKKIFKKPNL